MGKAYGDLGTMDVNREITVDSPFIVQPIEKTFETGGLAIATGGRKGAPAMLSMTTHLEELGC